MSIWLKGKHNRCKVYTDNIDNETISQLICLLNQTSIKDNKIRIMPDCHAGKGCVIGTTMTLKDKVIPNLVGVDIGCGMLSVKLSDTNIDFEKLDNVIKENIPYGFGIRDKAIISEGFNNIIAPINYDRAYKSIGTLGGGNHFIEIDQSEDGSLWLVIHTGSRHLGVEICTYYQNLAYSYLNNHRDELNTIIQNIIFNLKIVGRLSEIEEHIEAAKKEYGYTKTYVPKELAYVEGDNLKNYLHDMRIAQNFASINRKYIADIIIEKMQMDEVERFETIHNYIDLEHRILRKGSVSAQKDEKLIIPMNMRDGSLICIGKGNPEWNYSAPHGAGRIMSRASAKANIPLELYQESMQGIYSTCVSQSTLDESPFAYKPMDEIISNIGETVDILEIITPLYNFKSN